MSHTLDTSGNFYFFSAEGNTVKGPLYLREFVWVSDQASALVAANDFLASDLKGNRLFGKRATSDGDDLKMGPYSPGIKFDGIVITTMDAGYAYMVATLNEE